jgi:D-arginine dehydrogenase
MKVAIPSSCDVLIVGAGMAGASAASAIAAHRSVLVLERESQPGYHATGRSAAQFITSYGPPQVRALTRASQDFLLQPAPGFSETPLLSLRATLSLALREPSDSGRAAGHQLGLLDAAERSLAGVAASGRRLSPDEALAIVPVLRRERLLGALLEPESWDIDVHALHQAYLHGLRQAGGVLSCEAEVLAARPDAAGWQVQVRVGGELRIIQAGVILNAAGAWCDEVARRSGVDTLGLVPKRRSAFLFDAPAGLAPAAVAAWPLVLGVDESFYFKPDAGRLFGSPANADPTEPQDVQPEELDIAQGAWAIEQATTLTVRPQRRWAGLRSFVADGELVAGEAPGAPGFFWCAGQGGYGIQTSPAMGLVCAALVCGTPWPEALQAQGLTPASLSPARPTLRSAAP